MTARRLKQGYNRAERPFGHEPFGHELTAEWLKAEWLSPTHQETG